MEKTKLLILRLTDRCNLACRYCYATYGGICKADMPFETAKAAIALFAQPGGKLKIQFTGGEPLLCAGLMQQIFQHVKSEGIQTAFSIQTNGTLLTRETCAVLREMRCAVGVSLDGIGEANALRVYQDGSPSLDDALAGVRALADAGMRCNLNAVVSRANQNFLGGLIRLAALLGNVHGVGLDMFRPIGAAKTPASRPTWRRSRTTFCACLNVAKNSRRSAPTSVLRSWKRYGLCCRLAYRKTFIAMRRPAFQRLLTQGGTYIPARLLWACRICALAALQKAFVPCGRYPGWTKPVTPARMRRFVGEDALPDELHAAGGAKRIA